MAALGRFSIRDIEGSDTTSKNSGRLLRSLELWQWELASATASDLEKRCAALASSTCSEQVVLHGRVLMQYVQRTCVQ